MEVASPLAIQIATLTRSVSYSEVASVTVLAWDTLITLSDEVELIWKQRWTPAKVLYLLARYLPLGFQLALLGINTDGTTGLHFTVDQCRKWMIFQAIFLQLVVTTVDIILMIRVFALYNKSRPLLIFLSTIFLAEIAYLSYNLATVTPRLGFAEDCFVRSSPPSFIFYWIVSLVFETLLFVLTLIKFVMAISDGWGKRPVMQEFVRDVTMVINSALYKSVHSPLAGICFTWLQSVLSFAGSRLILTPRRRSSIRAASTGVHTGSGDGVSIPLSPLSPRTIAPSDNRFSNATVKVVQPSFISKSATSSPISEIQKSHGWDTIPSPSSIPRDRPPLHIRVDIKEEHEIFEYDFDQDSATPQSIQKHDDVGLAV
ncbi:hypothetical protein BDY19DRAFT_994857 [Irpex rosettiformis]|uniref:Uncharacterized protein n=1 Tax=Irpex rosettiformis TaxID=378272 RepID=A0ACB8TZY0_9APHY|nr:hypothetical protein BDY19DRAFT_994857 [Irpex rosettiformis]